MNRYITFLLFPIYLASFVSASTIEEADKVALKYCKQEFTYSGSLPVGYTGDINNRMYLERMMQLKDGKLNAYYAKDLIEKDLSMYEGFLKTRISWKGAKVTKEDEKRFTNQIIILKSNLKLLEKHYPKDFKVFDRINKIRFGPAK